jgi:hypothetical protein
MRQTGSIRQQLIGSSFSLHSSSFILRRCAPPSKALTVSGKCASWKTLEISSKMRSLLQGAHLKLRIFEPHGPLNFVRARWCRTRHPRADACRRPTLPESAAHACEPPAKIHDRENDQTNQTQPGRICLWRGGLSLCGCGGGDLHVRFRRRCRCLRIQTGHELDPDFGAAGRKHQDHDDRQQDNHCRKPQSVLPRLAARRPRTSANRYHATLLRAILSNEPCPNRDSNGTRVAKAHCLPSSLAIICG